MCLFEDSLNPTKVGSQEQQQVNIQVEQPADWGRDNNLFINVKETKRGLLIQGGGIVVSLHADGTVTDIVNSSLVGSMCSPVLNAISVIKENPVVSQFAAETGVTHRLLFDFGYKIARAELIQIN